MTPPVPPSPANRTTGFEPPPGPPPSVNKSPHGRTARTVASLAVLVLLAGAFFVFRQFNSSGSKSDEGDHAVFLSVSYAKGQSEMKVVTETGTEVYDLKFSGQEPPPGAWSFKVLGDDTTWGFLFVNGRGDRMVIDRNGRKIFKPEGLPVSPFAEGLAVATLSGNAKDPKCGYVNRDFKMVIPAVYDSCYDFSDGLGVVADESKKLGGYVDRSGKLQLPLRYEVACSFSDGVAKVVLNNRWVFIDKNGSMLFGARATGCQPFTDGRAGAPDGKLWGYQDRSGKFVIPARYDSVRNFSGGRAFVLDHNVFKLIDLQGNEIPLARPLEAVEDFKQGLAQVKVAGKLGLLDTSGRLATPPEYEKIEPAVSGLRVATRPGQTRGVDFLDAQGRVVKPPLPLCADYRAGVFTCLDEKAAQANPLLAGLGLNIAYITRSGQRIGGIGLSPAK